MYPLPNWENQMDPSIRQYIMSQPDCTRLHGWFTESAADHDFRKALLTIRDSTATFEHFPAMPKVLHLFTDGSGTDATKRHLRMVTMVSLPCNASRCWFSPAAAGGVPGILQTVLRAEITAVIAACRFGVHHHKPFYIFGVHHRKLSQKKLLSEQKKMKHGNAWNSRHTHSGCGSQFCSATTWDRGTTRPFTGRMVSYHAQVVGTAHAGPRSNSNVAVKLPTICPLST